MFSQILYAKKLKLYSSTSTFAGLKNSQVAFQSPSGGFLEPSKGMMSNTGMAQDTTRRIKNDAP